MISSFFANATKFFADLEADNSRDFWQANRVRYDQTIRPTFESLINHIPGGVPWRIYRPYNDTRFQSAKEPYKTFIGAVAERPDGIGLFVQISKRGLLLGTGMPMPAADQLPKLRQALADEPSGNEFLLVVAELQQRGATVHGGRWQALKRVPKPFAPNHPRAAYLCWKGVEINYRWQQVDWANLEQAAAAVNHAIQQAEPLHRWLADNVGPSSISAEERFAPKRKPS